eukprot:2370678-Rhodomonas_salina.1
MVASGQGLSRALLLSVGSGVHSFLRASSFDIGLPTACLVCNIPHAVSTLVLIKATGLSPFDSTGSVRVGTSSGQETSWISQTSMLSRPSVGGGVQGIMALSIGGAVGSVSGLISYDIPTVFFLATNMATSGGKDITLLGRGLGTWDGSPSVRTGQFECAENKWRSSTSVACKVGRGAGAHMDLNVLVLGSIGTVSGSVSYDRPTVSGILPRSGPTTGSGKMYLEGQNFGHLGAAITVYIGNTECSSPEFLSNSLLSCIWTQGVGANLDARVQVESLVGGLTHAFSYYSPFVSAVRVLQGPASGGGILTIFGSQFGTTDSSPAGLLGGSTCARTLWTSDSSAVCTSMSGVGVQPVGLDVAGQICCQGGAQVYAKGFVTSTMSAFVISNSPSSGGSTLEISTANLGMASYTPTMHHGVTFGPSTNWIADSSIRCQSVSAQELNGVLSVAITLAFEVSKMTQVCTVDTPSIFQAISQNVGAKSLISTLVGNGFGSFSPTARAHLGGSGVRETSWLSASSVVARATNAHRPSMSVVLTASSQEGSMSEQLSFDHATFSVEGKGNQLATTVIYSAIAGSFKPSAPSPSFRVGATNCLSTWHSETSLTCRQVVGQAVSQRLAVTVLILVASLTEAFSFSACLVSGVSLSNFGNTGQLTTVHGENFDTVMSCAAGRVAVSSAEATFWFSDSTVSLQPSTGTTSSTRITLTVGLSAGTGSEVFSFDRGPMVAASLNAMVSISEATDVSLQTFDSAHHHSLQVRITSTGCAATEWTTDTSILCRFNGSPSGSRALILTSGSRLGTHTVALSFDSARLRGEKSSLNIGLPSTLFVAGLLRNQGKTSISVRFEGSSGESTIWTSYSSVVVRSASGTGTSLSVLVTVGLSPSSTSNMLSFDTPVTSAFAVANRPSASYAVFFATGTAHGTADTTTQGRDMHTALHQTLWMSDTATRCNSQGIISAMQSFQITVNGNFASVTECLSTDIPKMSSAPHSNSPTTGSGQVLVVGKGFGLFDFSITSRLAGTACEITRWTSDSSSAALVASGSSVGRPAVMTVARLAETTSLLHSYDASTARRLHAMNAPAIGGLRTSISGSGFAPFDI